jgi:hypothetical protein
VEVGHESFTFGAKNLRGIRKASGSDLAPDRGGRSGPYIERLWLVWALFFLGTVEGRATDLHRPQTGNEESQKILLKEEPPHAAMAETWVDFFFDLSVRLGGFGPMERRFVVMDSVVAVAKEQDVQEPSREIPRMVAGGPRIGVHVLHVVEEHDRPKSEKCRDPQTQGIEFEPVGEPEKAHSEERHGEMSAVGDRVLDENSPIEGGVLWPVGCSP